MLFEKAAKVHPFVDWIGEVDADKFRMAVGVVEVICCSFLILGPRPLSFLCSVVLLTIMVGAVQTLYMMGERQPATFAPAVITGTALMANIFLMTRSPGEKQKTTWRGRNPAELSVLAQPLSTISSTFSESYPVWCIIKHWISPVFKFTYYKLLWDQFFKVSWILFLVLWGQQVVWLYKIKLFCTCDCSSLQHFAYFDTKQNKGFNIIIIWELSLSRLWKLQFSSLTVSVGHLVCLLQNIVISWINYPTYQVDVDCNFTMMITSVCEKHFLWIIEWFAVQHTMIIQYQNTWIKNGTFCLDSSLSFTTHCFVRYKSETVHVHVKLIK